MVILTVVYDNQRLLSRITKNPPSWNSICDLGDCSGLENRL